MEDYFDQHSGVEEVSEERGERPSGCSIYVNGSFVPVEEGSNFLQAVKAVALNAGFGKFRVMLNGEEVRPTTAPTAIEPGMDVSLRPYDEAG